MVVERLKKALPGVRCSSVSSPERGSLELLFPGTVLALCAGTDGQRIGLLQRDAPSSPEQPWNDLLSGAELSGISQVGSDRIVLFHFHKARAYRSTGMTLRFEATGRNSNLILTRDEDERILACTRLVTGRMSRYRSIAPGAAYIPPPSSGRPLSEWTSPEVRGILLHASSPSDMHRILEGVGRLTASAILEESALRGTDPGEVAAFIADRILSGHFEPWMGRFGPMPVKLGEGRPIEDPFSVFGDSHEGGMDSRLESFLGKTASAIQESTGHLARVRDLLDSLPSSETLRMWGQILLANSAGIPRGATEVALEDWEGTVRTIPLRPSKTAVENAERYFRKAGNADAEAGSLRERIAALESRLASIEEAGRYARETGSIPAEKDRRRTRQRDTGPEPVLLSDGWRCWIGRSSRDNEEITFRIGRRGDWWLHVRGIPGPHAVLRGEAGRGNPPAAVVKKAAELAAEGAACTSAIVPVDVTQVQYVKRIRGGKPGEVTYSREKTIFVSPGGENHGRRIRGRGKAFDSA